MTFAKKLLYYSLTRLLIGGIVVVAATLGTQFALAWAGSLVGFRASDPAWWGGLEFAASAIAAFFGYRLFVQRIEQRHLDELSSTFLASEGLIGVFLGACLFATTIGILAAGGLVQVSMSDKPSAALLTLGIVTQAGVAEELLFRGVLLRLIERSLGSILALTISALLFSGLHLFNPGASSLSAVAIAVAAVLQGAAFLCTRRLWLPIGLHFSWGVVESVVFGVADSGNPYPGVLRTVVSGPTFLSGGAFGVETSIVAMSLCLFVAVILITMAYRRGHLVPIHFGVKRQA